MTNRTTTTARPAASERRIRTRMPRASTAPRAMVRGLTGSHSPSSVATAPATALPTSCCRKAFLAWRDGGLHGEHGRHRAERRVGGAQPVQEGQGQEDRDAGLQDTGAEERLEHTQGQIHPPSPYPAIDIIEQ